MFRVNDVYHAIKKAHKRFHQHGSKMRLAEYKDILQRLDDIVSMELSIEEEYELTKLKINKISAHSLLYREKRRFVNGYKLEIRW